MTIPKKKKVAIASVVILLLAAAAAAFSVYARREVFPEVQTAKVERHSLLESKVTANGEVRPIQFINLTAEVSGRVIAIFVKEGDQVVKGKPLLRVDPTQQASSTSIQEAAVRAGQAGVQDQTVAISAAENAISDKQAELNTVKADLERVKVEHKNAGIELKRNTELLESGIVSRSIYDTARMRYDATAAAVDAAAARVEQMQVQTRNAEIRVDQARAALDGAQARAEQARVSLSKESDLLSKTTQYSPINGVVANLPIQIGTFALANFISTPLMIIADMSVINVEVRVDEADVSRIKAGQTALVKVDALGNQEIQGEVVEIAASAVTRSGQTIAATAVAGSQEAKDFKVVIRLVNLTNEAMNRLRPGMSATATISTDRRENVLAIPLQAIVEDEQPPGKTARENKAKKGVFVIRSDKAVFTPVETGITGENDIEISSGLQEQQEIVIGPYRQLRSLKSESVIKRDNRKPQVKDAK